MSAAKADVVVVTGGHSGIGRATCDVLRTHGYCVAIFDTEIDGAHPQEDSNTLSLKVDVSDESSVAAGFAQVREAFGSIDVLVNNAGTGGGPTAGLCHETPLDVWERVQGVNARGPFLCSRAVLPSMMAKGYGHIITIASVNSLVALPGRCAYSASKGAALLLTRSIATDYGHKGIRANAICPGFIRTPLIEDRLDNGTWDIDEIIPLRRAGSATEIAQAVYLLASGQLDYMNGAAWVIDGGVTAFL